MMEDKPKNVTKLLFSRTTRIPRALASFVCGQSGIFVDRFYELVNNRAIVVVNYEEVAQVDALLTGLKTMNAWRIIKSAAYNPAKPLSQSFIDRTTVNALSLLRGRTIRIKSDDHELRRRFYESVEKMNASQNFGCRFDFDEYDVALTVQKVERLGHASPGERHIVLVYADRPITALLPKDRVH